MSAPPAVSGSRPVGRLAAWTAVLAAAAGPWAFGATDPVWSAALAVACLVPAAAALLEEAARPGAPGPERRVAVVLLALPAVAAIGLLPLPGFVRGLCAPWGSALRETADPGSSEQWHPLSLSPSATVAAAALAAAYAGAFVVLWREAARPGGRAFLVTVLSASGVGLAVLGLVQHLTQRELLQPRIYWTVEVYEAGTPFGPYVNRNHFAGAMVLLASVAAGECLAAWAASRRRAALLPGAAAVVMLVALAATTSKGGSLGAASAAAFLVASAPSGRRIRAVLTGTVVAAVVAAALAWSGILETYASRMTDLYGRWANRFAVQRDALAAFAGNPVAGTGAGTFEDVFPAFQRVRDERSFSNAHSDWAQILMETGLLGAAVAVAALRALRDRVRALVASGDPSRWRCLGPAAGAVGIAVHGLFDVNLHVPANALLTAAALSLAFTAAPESSSGAPDGARP